MPGTVHLNSVAGSLCICCGTSVDSCCIPQYALENELQKKSTGGDGLSPAGQKAYIETLAQTLCSTTKHHGGSVRPEDILRRSEVST